MQNPETKTAVLFADSPMGVFIPQFFGQTADRSKFTGINAEQYAILEAGPDANPEYWDAWDEVLNNAETTCSGVLHQDGDLWIIWPEQAIDAINSFTEQHVEYEEKHGDAGSNFGALVSEAWCERTTSELIESLNEEKRDVSVKDHFAADSYKPKWQLLGVDERWKTIDPDTLADMAIESFDMKPGHVFGPYDGGLVLAGFPIGEIEIDLSHLGIDGVTLDFIREGCEPYISGCDTAYVATDAAWYAVLDVEAFNAAIANHFIH